ncbi:CRM-domain containing factor CFM2, chloroplastic [Aristolochia californica]|uniref:CRM-domain containing factor CFM2, chloroplastic n=1 Tax=Aristolochia californica TaxID=171875 RepID=UPI0035D5BE6D
MLLPHYLPHPFFSPQTPEKPFSFSPLKILCSKKFDPPKTAKSPETLSKTAIQRITEKLRSLGYVSHEAEEKKGSPLIGPGSPGEIFISRELPTSHVGYSLDGSWSSPDNPVPEPGVGPAFGKYHAIRRLAAEEKRREKELAKKEKRESPPTVAELTIPEKELKRLQSIGIRLEKRLKVGKAGITEGIVNGIHERWRRSELVKIRCEDLCRTNMKRTHEILERKTGGLVIWRSGSVIILYRGTNYVYPYFSETTTGDKILKKELSSEPITSDEQEYEKEESSTHTESAGSSSRALLSSTVPPSFVFGVGSPNRVRLQLPGEAQLEAEADRLIDGLGPRFTDWWGYNPLPVDADLLPAVIPGYRKPFRLLPYGVKPKLTDREMTTLRRLARPLPCHFALGRNRKLQGLAAAMIKLWEKCEVAKIAVKRGVQNTNSRIMAEELKWLSGGTLLSRDREFITFYRGKDFLPPAVSAAIEERRKNITLTKKLVTDKHSSVFTSPKDSTVGPSSAEHRHEACNEKESCFNVDRRLKSTGLAVRSVEAKLSLALEKKAKAENLLTELDEMAEPGKPEVDKEGISEEERYMLRKVGLRMKPFLLMGRRGIFDGTIENMHLHWKYRELVKIICKDRCVEEVHRTAQALEAESGGILVALERVNKGHAIIVYRGKNYQRPANLRPQTLLNKREAMKRSLEAQRHESLKLHVLKLARNINRLKQKLEKDEMAARSKEELKTSDPVELIHEQPHVEEMVQNSFPRDKGESAEAESLLLDEVECQSDHAHTSYSPNMEKEHSDNDVEDDACANKLRESLYNVPNDKVEFYVEQQRDEPDVEMPFQAPPLSNKERLLLRKQALKIKKYPVLAIGRNNVVTGVAKAIKTHFRKNPLAIVNVKGRAKGTSVKEIVFKLEQATGAVLVSQEPSKVILYRGGGGQEEPRRLKEKKNQRKPSTDGNKLAQDAVSPDLMAAIRFECGLQTNEEEAKVSR